MAKPVVDLFREAADLDERDRATLAGLLLESLDSPVDSDVESAWADEIERRTKEIDEGRVKLISWGDVKADLMRRFGGEPIH